MFSRYCWEALTALEALVKVTGALYVTFGDRVDVLPLINLSVTVELAHGKHD